jgi:hypothetical protein
MFFSCNSTETNYFAINKLYCCIYSNGVAELQGCTKHNGMSYAKTDVPVSAKYVIRNNNFRSTFETWIVKTICFTLFSHVTSDLVLMCSMHDEHKINTLLGDCACLFAVCLSACSISEIPYVWDFLDMSFFQALELCLGEFFNFPKMSGFLAFVSSLWWSWVFLIFEPTCDVRSTRKLLEVKKVQQK